MHSEVPLTSGCSWQTMLIWLPRGAKAARLARRPLMSSFHQATTTRLASRAAPSSSEDSALSMACAGSSRHHFKMPCRKTQYVEAQSRRALVSRYKPGSGRAAAPIFQYVLSITWGGLALHCTVCWSSCRAGEVRCPCCSTCMLLSGSL